MKLKTMGKSCKCLSCNSRSICTAQPDDQNKVKLNVVDVNKNIFDVIDDRSKISDLLGQCNHKELSIEDLLEQEVI
jgi:hypothetical protein